MSKDLGFSERLSELYAEREKLEGYRISTLLRNLMRSETMVNKNFEELSNAIIEMELIVTRNARALNEELEESTDPNERNRWVSWDPDVDTSDESEGARMFKGAIDAIDELIRLLHNYLSSVYSLVQHTELIRDSLNDREFENEYDLRRRDFATSRCHRFIIDLRTYFQHYGLPPITLEVTFGDEPNNPPIARFVFDKELLLNSESLRRSARSLALFFSSPNEIYLKTVVDEYQSLVQAFDEWFSNRIADLFSQELEELSRVNLEIKRLRNMGYVGKPPDS